MMRWLWAILGALVIVALGWYFWPAGNQTTVAPPAPAAQAPSPPPAQAPAASTAGQAPAPAPQAPAASTAEQAAGPAAQPPAASTAGQAAAPTAQEPSASTAAQAPAASTAATQRPTPPAAPAPARLALDNEDSVVHVSGSVHDEETKTSILDALKAVFGTEKVESDIAVDPNRAVAPWLSNFKGALESLKMRGVQAVFDGQSVKVGGAIGDAERDQIIAALKTVFGWDMLFGALEGQAGDAGAAANDKATNELASLKPGFVPKDLIAALNDSVINFPTGSAEVPASMTSFLHDAASDLKQVPKGYVLEIAGHTDNTGDAAINREVSQRRADAVRDALIKAGADPDMLLAKGYGSADPIASNDTPEGRLRNRRIEYHVVKEP